MYGKSKWHKKYLMWCFFFFFQHIYKFNQCPHKYVWKSQTCTKKVLNYQYFNLQLIHFFKGLAITSLNTFMASQSFTRILIVAFLLRIRTLRLTNTLMIFVYTNEWKSMESKTFAMISFFLKGNMLTSIQYQGWETCMESQSGKINMNLGLFVFIVFIYFYL